jgi:hypothetical protein
VGRFALSKARRDRRAAHRERATSEEKFVDFLKRSGLTKAKLKKMLVNE